MLPPPNFPDMVHVANGCFISSFVYLARFHAAYPAERTDTAAIVLPNADGSFKPHTVAIVSWGGTWWARDEFYGLADLRTPSSRPLNLAGVASRLDGIFRARAARQLAAGHRREPDRAPAGAEGTRWRLEQIQAAQQLLPVESEIIWYRSQGEALPFLFFRTSNQGSFAIYDPAIGSAQAVAEEKDAHRIVAAVAVRLGYPADPQRKVPEPVIAGQPKGSSPRAGAARREDPVLQPSPA